jgi:hypothetical protein
MHGDSIAQGRKMSVSDLITAAFAEAWRTHGAAHEACGPSGYDEVVSISSFTGFKQP